MDNNLKNETEPTQLEQAIINCVNSLNNLMLLDELGEHDRLVIKINKFKRWVFQIESELTNSK